jgi:hypothetical protein
MPDPLVPSRRCLTGACRRIPPRAHGSWKKKSTTQRKKTIMNSYRIGTLAEKIVAVKINLDGTITPFVRRRSASGWMTDIADPPHLSARSVAPTEFVARVNAGHSGVITMTMVYWRWMYPMAVIPLGRGDPFQPDEPAVPEESGPTTGSIDELRFRFTDRTLSWQSESMTGEMALSDRHPELSVVLRLPSGNQGELAFEELRFPRADGRSSHVLTAA